MFLYEMLWEAKLSREAKKYKYTIRSLQKTGKLYKNSKVDKPYSEFGEAERIDKAFVPQTRERQIQRMKSKIYKNKKQKRFLDYFGLKSNKGARRG